MAELADLLTNLNQRANFDKHFDKGDVIAQLPLETRVMHTVFKKIMVVGPRDILTVCKRIQVASDTILIASSSFEVSEDSKLQLP